jgi:hypothetical protein
MHASLVPAAFASLLAGLVALPAHSAVTVCDEPAPHSFAALKLASHVRSSLKGSAGSIDQEARDFALYFTSDSARFGWGLSHRYQVVDFSGIEAQTNGHLHTSYGPLHWQLKQRGVRLSVAPAISASSNVFKNIEEWESETLQVLAALVATTPLSATLDLRYGVCGDHRFGEYAVYPAVAAVWRPRPRWQLELGFPASRLAFAPREALRFTLGVAPDGNEWHVKDRDLEAGSRLVYEAIAVEWTAEWRAGADIALELSLGRQLDNRWEMTLADGERVSLRAGPANRVGIGVRREF